MSVAEFAICGVILAGVCAGTYELCRLQAIKSTLELVAGAHAAQLSFESLPLIWAGTFEPATQKSTEQMALENQIEATIRELLKSQRLAWTWDSREERDAALTGVRVWTNGPSFHDHIHPVSVRVQVCLKSWLEPALRVISDHRNCLGQFSKTISTGETRGISLEVSVQRNVAPSGDTYFEGELKKHEDKHTK